MQVDFNGTAGTGAPKSPLETVVIPAPVFGDALTVNASLLTGNGQVVSVSWDILSAAPHSSDTIQVLFSPANVTISQMYPLKYKSTASAARGSAT